MKTYKVYELINSMGTVEWVGETSQELRLRFKQHTQYKNGGFKGRSDLFINFVSEFNNRKDARELEGKLKLEYGLEWTEKIRAIKGGRKNGAENGKKSRKLTINEANSIRNEYKLGEYTYRKLAIKYNVGIRCIQNIINNKTYQS
jgi:hypothetical protein